VVADFHIGDMPCSPAPVWKPAPTRIRSGYTSI